MWRGHIQLSVSAPNLLMEEGSTYHADVAIGGFYEQIVSVSTVEGFQFQFATGRQGDAFGLSEAVGYCLQVFGRQIIGAVRVVVGF